MNSSDWYELYHHGVKGQHWGDRRWQNPDGSLTPEGYIHYGYAKKKINKKTGEETTIYKEKALKKRDKTINWYVNTQAKRYLKGDKKAGSVEYMANTYDKILSPKARMRTNVGIFTLGMVGNIAASIANSKQDDINGKAYQVGKKYMDDEDFINNVMTTHYADMHTGKVKTKYEAMYTAKHSLIDDDFLAHFGIPGQKWGIRRWQNPDGSLTPAGYTHYGYSGRGTRSRAEAEEVVKALNDSGEYARKSTSNSLFGTKYHIERVPDNNPDYMKIQDRMEQQDRVTKALSRISSEKMKDAKEKNVYDVGFLEVYDQDDKPKSDKELLKEYENYLKNPYKWYNKMSLPENFRSQPNSKFTDFEQDIYGDMESHIKDKNSGAYGHMSVTFNNDHAFSKADISKVMSNIEKYRAEVKNELNGFKIPGHDKPINSKDVGYFHLDVDNPMEMKAVMQYLGSYEGIDNPLIYFKKHNGRGKWIYDSIE